jgi:hypothetical protein
MAKKKKAAVAAGAVEAARSNPYVQRVIEDDDLQDNVRVAFDAARDAYDRLSSSKSAKKTIQNDKKLHKDLQVAAEALKEAGASLSNPKKKSKKRKGGGLGRKLLILGVAGGLAIALSADLRSKVLDALFGAEEEFDYTSTTTPSAAPTTGATA